MSASVSTQQSNSILKKSELQGCFPAVLSPWETAGRGDTVLKRTVLQDPIIERQAYEQALEHNVRGGDIISALI